MFDLNGTRCRRFASRYLYLVSLHKYFTVIDYENQRKLLLYVLFSSLFNINLFIYHWKSSFFLENFSQSDSFISNSCVVLFSLRIFCEFSVRLVFHPFAIFNDNVMVTNISCYMFYTEKSKEISLTCQFKILEDAISIATI